MSSVLDGVRPGVREATAPRQTSSRLVAVDVLRGGVLFFLLPDLAGGFSFYKIAEANPDAPAWGALAQQFRHVPWAGVALWDLVMPLFVFLVGVAMALSHDGRVRSGQGRGILYAQAVLRSVTLLALGLILQMRWESRVDELLALFVLTSGLPLGRWIRRLSGGAWPKSERALEMGYASVVLVVCFGWLAAHLDRLGNYQFGIQILALMGLAYVPAFAIQRQTWRVQIGLVFGLTLAYWLAFVLYVPDATARPVGEVWTGFYGHWNNGNNVAAAIDHWALNVLPRSEPYVGEPHGYHSLLFVPLIGVMVAGAAVGRMLGREGPTSRIAGQLAAVGICGLIVSGLMALGVSPMLKSLWTPTFSAFSISVCTLLLAGLVYRFGPGRPAGWAMPMVVLGTNSMLVYVLAFTQRWRIVGWLDRLPGTHAGASLAWWPLVQSCFVLAVLWMLALAMYRLKVFVRI